MAMSPQSCISSLEGQDIPSVHFWAHSSADTGGVYEFFRRFVNRDPNKRLYFSDTYRFLAMCKSWISIFLLGQIEKPALSSPSKTNSLGGPS